MSYTIVLNTSVLLNLLFVIREYEKLFFKLKELIKQKNIKIIITSKVRDEIKIEWQINLLNKLIENKIVEIYTEEKTDMKLMGELKNRYDKLGYGEISVWVITRKLTDRNITAVGLTNDKTALSKMKENEVPVAHGLWLYSIMRYNNLLSEEEFNDIIIIANKDMKLRKDELDKLIKEYLNYNK